MSHLIGAVDQGTTSTRFMVFDRAGSEVARHQLEDLRQNWKADREWTPARSIDQRKRAYAGWKKAAERSLGW